MTDATARPTLGSNYWRLFSASVVSNLGDGVGLVAYPWLASAVTRNPLLIALVAVVQRLPWLLFSLPAGVITDRFDRRTLIVWSNAIRAALTLAVGLALVFRGADLPTPEQVTAGIVHNDVLLYVAVLIATLLLGSAEVIGDNASQTFMPAVVKPHQLERANGRLWAAEQVANTFVGPPLGAALLAVSFSLPFLFDGATFAVAAVLVALIVPTERAPKPVVAHGAAASSWKSDIAEGFRWLWGHDLLRPMAIILGLLNLVFTLSMATMVLFAQEVLNTSPTEFALLMTGGALGGVVGGWSASWVSKRIGSGPSLGVTLVGGAVTTAISGAASQWLLVWFMFAISTFGATLWNVITVSLRQTIIPDHLLGRVNSVYRFFAWGMIPVGALLGGLVVVVAENWVSRDVALRAPWFIAAAGQLLLYAFASTRLTTARMDAARAQATA